MNRLLDIGLQTAGHWLLDGDSLVLELLRHFSQKNILYAFISDGEVKYVGKTTRTLATRLTLDRCTALDRVHPERHKVGILLT